jgi:HPt (histidine-containing phosphotransfer) domain-containing protein
MIKKNTHLCIEQAIQKVCDEDLVYELLIMLNSSIEDDWSEFEKCLNTNQYKRAANILHGMKGTIPIFSNKNTEAAILKTESLLLGTNNEPALEQSIIELYSQMQGFMSELKMWVKMQNQLPVEPT